jgi:predicted P-loop ATPase
MVKDKEPKKAKSFQGKKRIEVVEDYLKSIAEYRNNTCKNIIEHKMKLTNNWSSLNVNSLYCNLMREGIAFSKDNLKSLLASDFVSEYDAIDSYFKSLPKWDEIDHIEDLANYVKAKDQKRFNVHFKKALVRTIKNAVLKSGYFNKHCFVLVHATQNSGKTSFIRFLCPPALADFYTEDFSPAKGDKDSSIALVENVFINLDELAVLWKTEANALKAILSKNKIKIRRPYQPTATTEFRRSSFWASTNETNFLEDGTGNVRWLPFEIENINWEYSKKIDINKIWSQAFHLAKDIHFNAELSKQDIEELNEANKHFEKTTIEEELILKYYEPDETKDKANFKTASDILIFITSKGDRNFKTNNNTIGKILSKINFPRGSERLNSGANPIKGYYLTERAFNL